VVNDMGDLAGKQRWYGVADLLVLGRPAPGEEIVVGECLQSGCLADGKAAALCRVRMDEVVPVLGDVRRDRGCRPSLHLNAEPVEKKRLVILCDAFEILVVR